MLLAAKEKKSLRDPERYIFIYQFVNVMPKLMDERVENYM